MQSEELKPCPFCGGNNLQFRLSDIEGWIAHVECTDCDDMLGPMSEWKHDEKEDAEKDAAAVWNKRAAPPAPSVAVKAIEAVWKYSLVIESSVRRGDGPDQYAGVTEALRLVKEARSALSAQVQDVAGLESNPVTLRWWCQQLLDIIENYDISHDSCDEEIALINDIRSSVDPAAPAKQEGC